MKYFNVDSDSISLDENSISYGRTGKMPSKSDTSITITRTKDNAKGISEGGAAGTSQHLKLKSGSYAIITGEPLRSLSPAEQVAHQLLNGRPTAKGLRRQLSLDQRTMPKLLQKAKQANFRRAPSLEENSEPTTEMSTNTVPTGNTSTICINSSSCIIPATVAAATMSSSPSQNSTSSTSTTTTTVKSVVSVNPSEISVPNTKSAFSSVSNSGSTINTEETSGSTSTTIQANASRTCNNSDSVANNNLKVNCKPGKLSKILSVVEESPVLDRRHCSATTNPV